MITEDGLLTSLRAPLFEMNQRVDFLLHAHDIQGLGHLSRSVTIAMALRRLSPQSSILIITGSSTLPKLMAGVPIDFIKLPSYGCVFKNGRTYHTEGMSRLSHEHIKEVRRQMIRDIVETLRPKCLLVDHRPMGQCEELLDALMVSSKWKQLWVLGMRGVPGEIEGVWTHRARRVFNQFYSALMYYGDQQLLGEEYRARLENNFCSRAIETGYVARAVELEKLGIISLKPKVKAKGLISFSWCSQKTLTTIRHLLKAIEEDFTQGFIQYWDLFVGPGEEGAKKEQLLNIIKSENNIRLCEFDVCYLTSIAESELAIAYAGYNTITDAFWANTKTIVISRENINFEQEMHACSLPEQCFTHLRENNVLSEELKLAFQRLLRSGNSVPLVNLCGAEITAKYLIRLASKHDQSES